MNVQGRESREPWGIWNDLTLLTLLDHRLELMEQISASLAVPAGSFLWATSLSLFTSLCAFSGAHCRSDSTHILAPESAPTDNGAVN